MDRKTKISLLKRGAVCLLLVMLYGIFGTLLHAGGGAREPSGSRPTLANGLQAR